MFRYPDKLLIIYLFGYKSVFSCKHMIVSEYVIVSKKVIVSNYVIVSKYVIAKHQSRVRQSRQRQRCKSCDVITREIKDVEIHCID